MMYCLDQLKLKLKFKKFELNYFFFRLINHGS